MIPRHFQIAIMLLLLGILVSGIFIITITHKEQAKTELAGDERPVAPPVGGKQERQADDCWIEQFGFGEILKLLELEPLAKFLALAELLGAGTAALRAVLTGDLVSFDPVLEQVSMGV